MGAAAALAIVVLVVATACGGGGGSDTRAAKRAISHDTQQQAESINLKLADFPDGWRASTPSADEAGNKKFRECIGVDLSTVTLLGDASSKDFAKGENATANSEAQITKTEEQATNGIEKVAAGLSSTKSKDCVRDAIGSTPGFKVGEIEVGELKFTPPPNVDDARAWEIVIPVEVTSGTANGLSISVYADIVYLQKGNVVASVSTSDALSPLDDALRAHLVQMVARRMSESPT